MDQKNRQEESPLKLKKSPLYHDSPKASLLFAAQTRSYDKSRNEVLKKVNPFICDTSHFESDKCSPGVFIVGKKSTPDKFSWSIDDISKIQPADIDSPKYVIEEYDDKTESQAQDAIEKYFSQTHSVLSPVDSCIGNWQSPAISTPDLASMSCLKKSAVSSTPCTKSDRRLIVKCDASVQTNLALPPQLPPELEALLKPYFNENYSENVDTEDGNLNNSTLRRKLFFNKEDELSPVKYSYDSPAPNYKDKSFSRMNWSVEKKKSVECPSSPDLSPIKTNSSQSFQSCETSKISDKMDISEIVTTSEIRDDDYMAISLEIVDENQDIFSSTKMTLKTQDSKQLDSADTGYLTLDEFQCPSKPRNQFFNSTSIM